MHFGRLLDKIRLFHQGKLPPAWVEAKRCWRDQYTPRLHVRLREAGMPIGSVLTMFDFIDLDEGRRLQPG